MFCLDNQLITNQLITNQLIINMGNRTISIKDIAKLEKAKANNKCGLLGACPNGNRWKAEIRIDGKKTYLGTLDTALEAHNMYLTAKRQHHVGNTL